MLAASFMSASVAYSATNVVTSLADAGPGSLREAIAAAQPGDTLVLAVTGTVSVVSGELALTKSLSIIGPGNSLLALSGMGRNRLFNASPSCVSLVSGITLQGGKGKDGTNGVPVGGGGATDGEPGQPGGAIINFGQLSLLECALRNNAAGNGGNGVSFDSQYQGNPSAGAPGGDGGAIYNVGMLRMTNCAVDGNASGAGGSSGHTTYSPPGAPGGHGGGIFNSGTLVLDGVVVAGNRTGNGSHTPIGSAGAPGGSGGGIYSTGQLTANRSVFGGNFTGDGGQGGAGKPYGGSGGSGGQGGGVFGRGHVLLINCVLSNNACGMGGPGGGAASTPAGSGGGGGCGAGLYTANATLVACSVFGNRSGGGGAGGFSSFAGGSGGSGGSGSGIHCEGTLNLTNCTISGNLCGGGGSAGMGGLFQGTAGEGGSGGGVYLGGSTQVVVACTIANNVAAMASSGYPTNGTPGGGGGIAGGSTVFLNCLVAANTGGVPDAYGTFSSLGHNLIGVTNGSSGFSSISDLAGSTNSPLNPQLAPLAANGGFGPTLALLSQSPAIDAGAPFGLALDQRGVGRPQGRAVDVGAYEYEFTIPVLRGTVVQGGSAFYLQGCGLPGTTHLYQASTNFGQWVDVAISVAGSDGVSECLDPNAAGSNERFYRLMMGGRQGASAATTQIQKARSAGAR